ncbi:2OG-Fe(II) oxygenase [Mycolicibacterium moriokaense]|nr:2OG-Fe(II) oxygenase [Mycolicibacterium moriokaense]
MTPITANDLYFFSRRSMVDLAVGYRDAFRAATPFPHVVIDDFLPSEVAERIGNEFPGAQDIDWHFEGPGDSKHTGDRNIEKLTTSDEEMFPAYIRHMMCQMQSGIFCRFLDDLTGYPHLAPDPDHVGCGLHSTGNGGRLMLHLDASRHPDPGLHQLINCIYYCSPDWQPEWGGELELWNADATECVKTVAPLFNRLVVFYTGGQSWHGHPQPVVAPPRRRRNSLALYFYTTDMSFSNIDHTKYVQWKAVTEYDKKAPIHYAKAAVRRLPTPMVNKLATFARKSGLNLKD